MSIDGYTISDDPARLDLGMCPPLPEHRELLGAGPAARDPGTLGRGVIVLRHLYRCREGARDATGQRGGSRSAFARVITDRATFAWLADVFVLPAHRGRGLSKRLLETILAHPDLQGLRRFMLATADAHGLYRQFGWKEIAKPQSLMERRRENAYRAGS